MDDRDLLRHRRVDDAARMRHPSPERRSDQRLHRLGRRQPGNRRAFAAALGDRLDDDDPEPLVLALFDLDGFKSYNDNFGHAAGDALLQRLAAGLEAEIGTAAPTSSRASRSPSARASSPSATRTTR